MQFTKIRLVRLKLHPLNFVYCAIYHGCNFCGELITLIIWYASFGVQKYMWPSFHLTHNISCKISLMN